MKKCENELIRYSIREGILYTEFKVASIDTVENVKKMIDLRHKISAKRKQYWCVNGLVPYSREARNYVMEYGQDYLHACAVVVSSHIEMFVFKSFAYSKKTRIPISAFKTKEKAVSWLKELKKERKN